MIDPENDPKYISSDRVTKLAFLFRREITNVLRRQNEMLMASTISCALRGDDETNKAAQFCIDQLTMLFHPDKQQRHDAAQRILDDLEFRFESDIKKLEFTGDLETAKAMRKQMHRTRAGIEKKVGMLARKETVESYSSQLIDTSTTGTP